MNYNENTSVESVTITVQEHTKRTVALYEFFNFLSGGNQRHGTCLDKARTERNRSYLRGAVLLTGYYHICTLNTISIICF